jgi:mannose-6-phosphate isomerase class I
LSLQVHPTKKYAKEKFGINYTQSESYYYLEAEPNAKAFLGLKNNVKLEEFINALEEAQKTGKFKDEDYVYSFPIKKHDHLLHFDGVVHSQASGSMVLEISQTPYIFTFKL